MRKFSVRKSDFSIEGFFAEPAFDLLSANSDVLSAVSPSLADFCPIRGADIRIDQDASPLGNANVVFELRALNGFARISIDRAQIVLFSPHRLNQDLISRLAASFLEAVKDAASAKSYGHYIADLTLHAALDDITPEDHTREFVLPSGNNLESAVGNSVTYYFGKHDRRIHSSVRLDMSAEFPDCVLVHIVIGLDANEISAADLSEPFIDHSNALFNLIGLEPEW